MTRPCGGQADLLKLPRGVHDKRRSAPRVDPWKSSEEYHKNGLTPSHSRFRTSPAIHQHFILAQKSKQLCGTIKSRCYWANYNNYGFCQTGQLTPAVHVCNWVTPRAYLGTPLTCHQHQENHLNKNFIPIEEDYWIVIFPFEWQSKMCRTVKWNKHGGAFCQKKFFDHKKMFESSIFQNSPRRNTKRTVVIHRWLASVI